MVHFFSLATALAALTSAASLAEVTSTTDTPPLKMAILNDFHLDPDYHHDVVQPSEPHTQDSPSLKELIRQAKDGNASNSTFEDLVILFANNILPDLDAVISKYHSLGHLSVEERG
mmetsp:Transcript_23993/g.36855  ORF Transcript_23993/g.36855 Transcript_23993/m.36855 type:complete len:116 (+) Transcript_23993:3-350(+)